ncbi:hypothetical protein ACFL0C_00600 [Patescibacteria group bacterium]
MKKKIILLLGAVLVVFLLGIGTSFVLRPEEKILTPPVNKVVLMPDYQNYRDNGPTSPEVLVRDMNQYSRYDENGLLMVTGIRKELVPLIEQAAMENNISFRVLSIWRPNSGYMERWVDLYLDESKIDLFWDKLCLELPEEHKNYCK